MCNKTKIAISVLFFFCLPFFNLLAETPVKTVIQEGHNGRVSKLIFSRDSGLLVSIGEEDNLVKLWDAKTGSLIRDFKVTGPRNFSFSADNNFISINNCILNSRDGSIFRTFDEKALVCFSPDARSIAELSPNANEVRLRDFSTNNIFRTLKRIPAISKIYNCQREMEFSPSGKYLYIYPKGMGRLEIWDTQTGDFQTIEHLILEGNESLSFSPDDKLLAVSRTDGLLGYVAIWDMKQRKFIKGFRSNKVLRPGLITKTKFISDKVLWIYSTHESFFVDVYSDICSNPIDLKLGISGEEICINPQGQFLALSNFSFGKGGVKLIGAKDSRLIWQTPNSEEILSIQFSPDNKFIVYAAYGGQVKIFEAKTGRTPEIYRNSGFETGFGKAVGFSKNGELLALSVDEFLKVWDMKTGVLLATLGEKAPTEPGPFGTKIYIGNHFVTSLDFSADGKYIAASKMDSSIEVWDLKNFSLIKKVQSSPEHSLQHSPILFSPDSKWVVSIGVSKTLKMDGGNENPIRIWDVKTGGLVKEIPNQDVSSFAFSPDCRFIAATGEGKTKIWETKNFKLIKTIEDKPRKLIFSPNGKYLIGAKGYIKIWEIASGKLTSTFGEKDLDLNDINFSGDGKFLISTSSNGRAIIWDFDKEKPVVTFYNLPNASVILTPEGFFSGTGDFNEFVHFVKALGVYDFNQFYDTFYRPDLIEKKLNGEDISKYTAGLNIEDCLKNPPPKAVVLSLKNGESVTERNINVGFQIKDTGGGIGDIRIYHNGKLIDSLGVYRLAKPEQEDNQLKTAGADTQTPYRSASRGIMLVKIQEGQAKKSFQTTAFSPLRGNINKTYNITLINGQNTISVAAFNGTNTVMSAMESVTINANIPKKEPNLFLLTIGNNHFKNHAYDLSLATKDANDFSNMVKNADKILYGKVINQNLIDANKALIINTVKSLSKDMVPEDIFILYVATHGKAEDDLYYLYSSDFDGNPYLHENYISSIELMEFSKQIPALKQVFVLDTCSAGGVESIVSGLYDTRISVLAKSLGMHIFAGSKTYQEAIDDYNGNGLFTYFLLEGLKGKANKNSDKEVTLVELNPYLMLAVKEASQEKQEPFIRNFGEDLPLSKLTK